MSKQSARMSVLLDNGLITGIITGCFAISLLASSKFGLNNILLISALSASAATILQYIMGIRFSFTESDNVPETENQPRKSSILNLLNSDTYTGRFIIYVSLSVITALFVQYSFLAVTRLKYPLGNEMAVFLGLFTGGLMLFTLLVKSVIFRYLIRKFGLRTCLVSSPVLLAGITIISVSIGITIGYANESMVGFLIFFILLALSKIISVSFKYFSELPSVNVIYQTIDARLRGEVRSVTNGTLNEASVILAGVLLTGLGALGFVRLIHFSLVLFFILLFWIYIAYKLYTEFRKSVRQSVVRPDDSGHLFGNSMLEDFSLESRFSAYRQFRKNYFKLVTGDYSSLEKGNNKWFYEKIVNHSDLNLDFNLIPVLKKIAVLPAVEESIRQNSAELIKTLEKYQYSVVNSNDRVANAKKVLSGTRQPQTAEILKLFRENSIEAKRLAIYMIGKFRHTDMLHEVCECLNIQGLETDASAVLQSFGIAAEDELEKFYLLSSGKPGTSKTILRLLKGNRSQESNGFLFSRLWSNSRQLKEVAAKCLIGCEFKSSDEEKDRLMVLISDIIGLMTWNLSAMTCLEKSNEMSLLAVMKCEFERWNDFLFNILSITFDPESILKIKKNLEINTIESVNLATELIDIVIDHEIRHQLISILGIADYDEKLRNLYHFFPGRIPKYNELLEAILNRDYNLLSIWTKACTLRSISKIESDYMSESVVALLFSQEILLQEESARLLARTSMELYEKASKRVTDSTRKRTDRIVNGTTDDMELQFMKIRFLKGYFKEITEEELISLAAAMKYFKKLNPEMISNAGDCILWSVSGKIPGERVILYGAEQSGKQYKNYFEKNNFSFYILELREIDVFLNHFPDRSAEILKFIESS
jgi:hypothetical protein